MPLVFPMTNLSLSEQFVFFIAQHLYCCEGMDLMTNQVISIAIFFACISGGCMLKILFNKKNFLNSVHIITPLVKHRYVLLFK